MNKFEAGVHAIITDLRGRKGLRHEWGMIDDEIKDEIEATWVEILEKLDDEVLLSSDEWMVLPKYEALDILDPDGWDRKNLSESWDERITEDEFGSRVASSTIRISNPKKFFNDILG